MRCTGGAARGGGRRPLRETTTVLRIWIASRKFLPARDLPRPGAIALQFALQQLRGVSHCLQAMQSGPAAGPEPPRPRRTGPRPRIPPLRPGPRYLPPALTAPTPATYPIATDLFVRTSRPPRLSPMRLRSSIPLTLVLLAVGAGTPQAASAGEEARLLRFPAISHDAIAFTYA